MLRMNPPHLIEPNKYTLSNKLLNFEKNTQLQLGNTQEIRREQLVAEHKEQMKMVDKLYLKVILQKL